MRRVLVLFAAALGLLAAVVPGAAAAQAAPASKLPENTHFRFGGRTVPAGTRVQGATAVANGDLDVYGVVDGNAIALNGSVRVHRGGEVTGSAYATGGQVIVDGGVVRGGQRSYRPTATTSAAPAEPLTTFKAIRLVLWSFAIVLIIGLGVLIFAEPNMDGVMAALERGFARSFWAGVAGQLLVLPALALLCVALALTIIGALLVPFAIVAYCIAVAGLATLGFLAAARLTGTAFVSRRGAAAERGVHVRAMVAGLVLYGVLWLAVAAFKSNAIVDAVLRGIALVATWAAMTIGLGATLMSRAGTQRRRVASRAGDDLSWQTPTPVAGVAAARRPMTVGSSAP